MARKWSTLFRAVYAVLRRRWFVAFLGSLLLTLALAQGMPTVGQTLETSSTELVESAQTAAQSGQLLNAISLLEKAIDNGDQQALNQAITLTNLGRLRLQVGQAAMALTNLDEADKLYGQVYRQASDQLDTEGYRLRNFVYQVRALRQLGLHADACEGLKDRLSTDDNRNLCTEDTLNYVQVLEFKENLVGQPDVVQSKVFQELGIVLRSLGYLDSSEKALLAGLTDEVRNEFETFRNSDTLDTSVLATYLSPNMLMSLANTYRAQGNLLRDRLASPNYDAMPWRFDDVNGLSETSLKRYEQSGKKFAEMKAYYAAAQQMYGNLANAPRVDDALKVRAQLNALSLRLDFWPFETEEINRQTYFAQVNGLAKDIDAGLQKLPVGQARIFAEISLAKGQAFIKQALGTLLDDYSDVQKRLKHAGEMADALQNTQALSYVEGNEAGLYEYLASENSVHNKSDGSRQFLSEAYALTEKALSHAQPIEAPGIAYQWQWQLARLEDVIGNREGAIAHYKQAVNTLDIARKNLLTINTDVQFSFRDNVEPVYRGLVDVLLQAPTEDELEDAVDLIDNLQLAELENFLQCNLSGFVQVSRDIQEIDPHAAFIYPIVLKDRLEVISRLPGGALEHHIEPKPASKIEAVVSKLSKDIAGGKQGDRLDDNDIKVYDWLLKPIEYQLEDATQVNTLVVVPDSVFRNLPISALFDDQAGEYVLEKEYATTILPSAQLFDIGRDKRTLNMLAIGVTDSIVNDRSFSELDAKKEIDEIEKVLQTKVHSLLDEHATRQAIQDNLKKIQPSILHFATHGSFSSDPDETYILLYDESLESQNFDQLFKFYSANSFNQLDLLTLGACKTASGDNRAVLGLAGVAVGLGARSTLASLWIVEDTITLQLMTEFYKQLKKPDVTAAQALHQAQKVLFDNGKLVNLWAPFILVGNWL